MWGIRLKKLFGHVGDEIKNEKKIYIPQNLERKVGNKIFAHV